MGKRKNDQTNEMPEVFRNEIERLQKRKGMENFSLVLDLDVFKVYQARLTQMYYWTNPSIKIVFGPFYTVADALQSYNYVSSQSMGSHRQIRPEELQLNVIGTTNVDVMPNNVIYVDFKAKKRIE